MDKRNILITGGAGFIGSHVIRRFLNAHPHYNIVCVDLLTYAGNLDNLSDVINNPRFTFIKADIVDLDRMSEIIAAHNIDSIIHLAAESHVDRSILDPFAFARTNVMGTLSLLQAAKNYWEKQPEGMQGKLFYHVSTDEVYGSLEPGPDMFTETTPYSPRSPYSASKASSDHFVRAYHHTYGMPMKISNCSNNYGPNQFPEKLIPLLINNIRHNKPLPVYGEGLNVRDWLYVEDHAAAIDLIFHNGGVGETYNIGGLNEWKNIDIVKLVISITDRLLGREPGASLPLITFVTDRKGHDLRYAIAPAKLCNELGWKPSVTFEEGIEKTVEWYLATNQWLDNVTSGEYLDFYNTLYSGR
ncbi:MAG: dTDP-glucose 4,6-dehydratase [Paramuribaculum sp.]|nr:dTDP-glucose 4,6-dehydratase [Paramuribaculum sp.]